MPTMPVWRSQTSLTSCLRGTDHPAGGADVTMSMSSASRLVFAAWSRVTHASSACCAARYRFRRSDSSSSPDLPDPGQVGDVRLLIAADVPVRDVQV
jgi:hypothetical protein